jgi:hypothetical protein
MKVSGSPWRVIQGASLLLLLLLPNISRAVFDPTLAIAVTRTNAGLVLQWPAMTGVTYQVESSVNLSTWSNASSVLTATGVPLAFTNPITGLGPRLLRIKRIFPAAPGTAAFNPATGILTIVGDLTRTNIDVTSSAGLILVNGGGIPITGGTAATSNTTLIQILGSPAADQISVAVGIAPAHIFGAEGNDTLSGGSFGDLIVGGPGTDTITSRQGNDLIYLDDGDTAVWNPGDGSDVIEGRGTGNTLAFNGSNVSENIALLANGSRLSLTRDVGAITMDMKGVQTIQLNMLGGADNITVNSLAGTSVSRVNVDLSFGGLGDGSADTVIFNGSTNSDNFSTAANGASVEVTAPGAVVSVSGGESANDRILFNGVGGDTVSVNGTSGADTMQIQISPISGARTTVGAYSVPVDVTGAANLVLNGLGLADTITGAIGVAGLVSSVTIDGGDGDDVITGTDAADTILGGAGNDTVTPSRGNDTVLLGADNDTVIWNPGDGSDSIEGQGGTNTLTFNGANIAENIALSTNGSRLTLTRDVAAITMDGNGIQTVNLAVLGGADNITVNSLVGTSVTTVNIDANVSGGAGDGAVDTVTLNGTGVADAFSITASAGAVLTTGMTPKVLITHPEAISDKLIINGLGGTDTFSVGAGVSSLLTVTTNQ